MCGINGFMQFKNIYSKLQISSLITKMNNCIVHRGPDDSGLYADNNIGIGMRRLSIIDLCGGSQPIFNEDNSMVIVLNGEIYNYKELKREMKDKGHIFKTDSDTEVVLHCYEEYGLKSFNRLNGMFAFIIYDIKNKKMICVRDRAGEKPLYYYKDQKKIIFASEIKSILINNYIKKSISKEGLNQYLSLTYIPSPLTIFENIFKIPSGTYLEIDKSGKMNKKKYWEMEYNEDNVIYDYSKCKKNLKIALFKSVEECMISDVPLGAFLSGGIDSSIIVSIMSKISSKKIDTFTIGYKGKKIDESKNAKLVSEYNKTNHHTYFLDFNNILPELDNIMNNIDEPFADSSYLPTYVISKYARKYVKAVLTGDSGDELFGGYNKYLIGYYSNLYKKIPPFMRKNIFEKIIYALPEKASIIRKVKKVIRNINNSIFEQRLSLMCLGFPYDQLKFLLKPEYVKKDILSNIEIYYKKNINSDEIYKALYTDFKIILEGDMLTKVDRASMLNSLETRVPLLHKYILDLVPRIPSKYKINRNKRKTVLKDTFKDILPSKILNFPKKGFVVPIGEWFKKELKEDLLSEMNKEYIVEQGIFNYEYINNLVINHMKKENNKYSELWTLYIFQKWYKNYFSI